MDFLLRWPLQDHLQVLHDASGWDAGMEGRMGLVRSPGSSLSLSEPSEVTQLTIKIKMAGVTFFFSAFGQTPPPLPALVQDPLSATPL